MPNIPLIIVHVIGGVVQEIEADVAVRVLVLDFDTDGIDNAALTGPLDARAVVGDWPINATPARITAVVNQYLPVGGEDDGAAAPPGVSG